MTNKINAPSIKTRRSVVQAAGGCVLALALTAGVALPSTAAWADFTDPTSPASTTSDIAVSGVEEGVNVNAYRIITAIYDTDSFEPSTVSYAWASPEIAQWVSENYSSYLGDEIDGTGYYAVAKAFEDDLGDDGSLTGTRPTDNGAAGFFDAIASSIKAGELSVDVAGTAKAAAGGTATIDDVVAGSYLVLIDNGMKVYRPSVANLVPRYDEGTQTWSMPASASIIVKASEVPVSKSVTSNTGDKTYGVGDTVSYEIEVGVPVYPDDALNKTLTIKDTLPAGMTLDAGSVKVYGATGEQSPSSDATLLTAGEGGDYVLDTASGIDIDFDYAKVQGYEKVFVTYDADVNGSAVVGTSGNVNTVTVDYATSPYTEGDYETTPGTIATVYTYGIELAKTGDAGAMLPGAEFTLAKKDAADAPLNFTGGTAGDYTLAAEGGAATIVSAEDGTITLSGLDTGTYVLTETKAPAGYAKLANPIEITITDANQDGAVDANANADNSGYVDVTVQNSKTFTLPVTGGPGTMALTIVGAALVAGGVTLTIKLRRDKRADDAAQA